MMGVSTVGVQSKWVVLVIHTIALLGTTDPESIELDFGNWHPEVLVFAQIWVDAIRRQESTSPIFRQAVRHDARSTISECRLCLPPFMEKILNCFFAMHR
jgi:hypothetical protein